MTGVGVVARTAISAAACLLVAACTGSINDALGTPKNPVSPFADPVAANRKRAGIDPFRQGWYSVLSQAAKTPDRTDIPAPEMRLYLEAGFELSNAYCGDFFAKTDESYRRRSFGRSITNDVGTIVQGVLNAASAGTGAVTALGVVTGVADSGWRNYDTAFLISTQLSNVKYLVIAKQENYRSQTLSTAATLPTNYASAQSVIRRYADFCSFLGMQDILTSAANDQRDGLKKITERLTTSERRPGQENEGGGSVRGAVPPAAAAPVVVPSSVDPPLTVRAEPTPANDNAAVAEAFPVLRWGDAPDRVAWTRVLLRAVDEHGADLVRPDLAVADAATYCPGYGRLDRAGRRIFWAALLSSLAEPESGFDPRSSFVESFRDATGDRVVSRGLLQLSLESARGYGCVLRDADQLHDPATNLACGVRILNRLVARGGAVSTRVGTSWRGAAAYWSPFRTNQGRERVAGWVRGQPFCAA